MFYRRALNMVFCCEGFTTWRTNVEIIEIFTVRLEILLLIMQ